MTCIVGLVHEGGVTLGADSQVTPGWMRSTLASSCPKIFRVGGMLIGCTGTVRLMQLVRYSLVLPEHPEDMECVQYLATRFADAVRDCMKNGGYAMKEKEQEFHGGALLIAYRGRLFESASYFDVCETTEPYYAVGSGQEMALGSMHTSTRMGELIPPQKSIAWALEAAAAFSNSVGGPFIIETLANDTAQQEGEAA